MTMTKILEIEAMATRLQCESYETTNGWPAEANVLLRDAASIVEVAASMARDRLEGIDGRTD